jgi:transposase InsO family protein
VWYIKDIETTPLDVLISYLKEIKGMVGKEEHSSVDAALMKFEPRTLLNCVGDSIKGESQMYSALYNLKELVQHHEEARRKDLEERVCTSIVQKFKTNSERPNCPMFEQNFHVCLGKAPPLSGNPESNKEAYFRMARDLDLAPVQLGPKTLDDLIHRVASVFKYASDLINNFRNFFGADILQNKNKPVGSHEGKAKQTFTAKASETKQEKKEKQVECYGCGFRNHKTPDCDMKKHPNFNTELKPFAMSEGGKSYLQALVAYDSKMNKPILSNYHKMVKGKIEKVQEAICDLPKTNGEFHLNLMNTDENPNNYIYTNPNFINGVIRESEKELNVKALLDNGAFNGHCYISTEVENFLKMCGNKGENLGSCRVCMPIGNSCVEIDNRKYLFKLHVINEFKVKKEIFIIATPINTNYDIIINRQFIKENSLVLDFPSHFMNEGDIQTLIPKLGGTGGTVHERTNAYPNAGHDQPHQEEVRVPKEALLDISPEDDGGVSERWDNQVFPWEMDNSVEKDDEECIPKKISGPIKLVNEIRALCLKYINVFKRQVLSQPALINPFHILVDKEKMEKKLHSIQYRRPRMQSRERQEEIRRQNEKMLHLDVIRSSDALFVSQVHLAKKPNGTWRYCIDYRELNEISKAAAWPLPNIQHTLERLGRKGWKIFGVMDMTSGYWQAPLAEESKKYTAFTTWMGNYEWTRVPFGLKGAPSYYQKEVQHTVLRELMYRVCENYMDDIIFGGTDFTDYLNNLEKILKRMQEHNLTINPDKCTFGVNSIEVVGHVLDSTGISFSEGKRNGVKEFPLPQNAKQLHSFLGLANYFRSHVRNYTESTSILYDKLSKHQDDKKKLIWIDDEIEKFEEIKEKIHSCRKLFFVNDTHEIHLCTDASLYGIGAYLYQIIDGGEIPIQFLSSKLTKTQRRWSVPEKEGYAIYYALTKLEYLLRDVYFVLHTDHINLTFVNAIATTSRKVYNWKLTIQEFNFDIVYIKGENNVVADKLSRLCDSDPQNDERKIETIFLNAIVENYIPQNIRDMFNAVHNAVVGHNGFKKTMKRMLKAGAKHKDLKSFIRKLLRECVSCQKLSYNSMLTKTMPFTTASYELWECLNIDTIGPFLQDRYGFQYILNIIDAFSRFQHLIPMRRADAQSALEALIQHVGLFGVPNSVLTDNGTQFVNEAMSALMDTLGCKHITTTPYSKEENAIVERSNKESNRYCSALVNDKDVMDRWSAYVPIAQRIINSNEHEALGVAPAQLVFPNVRLDRMFPFEEEREKAASTKLTDYVQHAFELHNKLMEIARANQKERDSQHMQRQLQRLHSRPEFPSKIGDYVLADHMNGKPHKLANNKIGPYKLVELNNGQATIEDVVHKKQRKLHTSNLVPFRYDNRMTNPMVIAAKEKDYYIVERIITHKVMKKKTMFQVKWVGYEEPKDITWEPIENLKNNIIFHNYCKENNLEDLIPDRFKD